MRIVCLWDLKIRAFENFLRHLRVRDGVRVGARHRIAAALAAVESE